MHKNLWTPLKVASLEELLWRKKVWKLLGGHTTHPVLLRLYHHECTTRLRVLHVALPGGVRKYETCGLSFFPHKVWKYLAMSLLGL